MKNVEDKKLSLGRFFWIFFFISIITLIVYASSYFYTYRQNNTSAEKLNFLIQSNIMINKIKSGTVNISECLENDISEINSCVELQKNLLNKQRSYIEDIKKDNPQESEIEKNIDSSLSSLDEAIDKLITKFNEIKFKDDKSDTSESFEQLKKYNSDLINPSLAVYQNEFNKLILVSNQLFLKPELISPLKNSPLHQVLKDIITVGASIFTVFGVFIGGYAAFQTWNKSLETRNDEVRWSKANAANEIYKAIENDQYSSYAMRMLESYVRNYSLPPLNEIIKINKERMIEALERVNLRRYQTSKQYEIDRFIYDCFDHFFSVMQEMEHKIEIGLIDAEDVTYPFTYYAPLMYGYKDLFEGYFTFHFPDQSYRFLKRFAPWKEMLPISIKGKSKTTNNILDSVEVTEAIGRAGLRRSKLLVIIDDNQNNNNDFVNELKTFLNTPRSELNNKSIEESVEIIHLLNNEIYKNAIFSSNSMTVDNEISNDPLIILLNTHKEKELRKGELLELIKSGLPNLAEKLCNGLVIKLKKDLNKNIPKKDLNKNIPKKDLNKNIPNQVHGNRFNKLHPNLYALPESFTDTLNENNDFLHMKSDTGYIYIHKDRIEKWSKDSFHGKVYIEEISGEQYTIVLTDFEEGIKNFLEIEFSEISKYDKSTSDKELKKIIRNLNRKADIPKNISFINQKW